MYAAASSVFRVVIIVFWDRFSFLSDKIFAALLIALVIFPAYG